MDIIEQLKRDEGCKLHVYDDATGKPITKGSVVVGYPTIGIGRMVDLSKGGGLSQEEAEYLLQNDVQRVTRELIRSLPWFVELDDARKGVLLNMAFQIGIGGLLKFSNTLSLIKQGKYLAASNEMLDSTWAKQTPARAQRLSKQMATGIWQ